MKTYYLYGALLAGPLKVESSAHALAKAISWLALHLQGTTLWQHGRSEEPPSVPLFSSIPCKIEKKRKQR